MQGSKSGPMAKLGDVKRAGVSSQIGGSMVVFFSALRLKIIQGPYFRADLGVCFLTLGVTPRCPPAVIAPPAVIF